MPASSRHAIRDHVQTGVAPQPDSAAVFSDLL